MTTDRVDIATFETNPVPNQMMTMGASAMMGIDPSAMTKGSTTRETKPRIPERQAEQRADQIAR